ncbi:MAG TPA: hypothetical protein DCL41_07205, partial [Bdellovibrionales bacterium]|nr:hypothetical protein [Bdellovibrionales bacterium]
QSPFFIFLSTESNFYILSSIDADTPHGLHLLLFSKPLLYLPFHGIQFPNPLFYRCRHAPLVAPSAFFKAPFSIDKTSRKRDVVCPKGKCG